MDVTDSHRYKEYQTDHNDYLKHRYSTGEKVLGRVVPRFHFTVTKISPLSIILLKFCKWVDSYYTTVTVAVATTARR